MMIRNFSYFYVDGVNDVLFMELLVIENGTGLGNRHFLAKIVGPGGAGTEV
jgi:hypothetical protein